jgi:acyl-CoA thioesterase
MAVLRAMMNEVGDTERRARSLTVHFPRAVFPGAALIDVTVERAGRGMSTLSARLVQNERTAALAVGAFGVDRDGPVWQDETMPPVPPPAEVSPLPPLGPLSFTSNWEYRPCLGPPPFSGASEALSGGWLRPVDAQTVELPLLAAMADGWLPAAAMRLSDARGAVPTVDLTIHFRAALPDPAVPPGGWVLVRFRSQVAESGFWEEDGVIWSGDGRVLAQSRQLAIFPVRAPAEGR